MTLRRVLKEEGHDVIVEKRGDNGLAIAQKDSFDVVVTDMKLPGLNGLDLVRELHAGKPRLPIILHDRPRHHRNRHPGHQMRRL